MGYRFAARGMDIDASDARRESLYNDFHLLLFGEVRDREIGLSLVPPLASRVPRFPFAFHLPPPLGGIARGADRRGIAEQKQKRQGGGASGGRLRLARDPVLPRASSVSGVVSPPSPPPFHSPSRWPLLVPVSRVRRTPRIALETTT